ncbi:hypothetical protein ACFLZ5_05160 [Thermodesulfobacteriota bacterium]
MKRKKVETVENKDKMKRLERLHAKWKEKQLMNKRLELEELLIDESYELDLERRW